MYLRYTGLLDCNILYMPLLAAVVEVESESSTNQKVVVRSRAPPDCFLMWKVLKPKLPLTAVLTVCDREIAVWRSAVWICVWMNATCTVKRFKWSICIINAYLLNSLNLFLQNHKKQKRRKFSSVNFYDLHLRSTPERPPPPPPAAARLGAWTKPTRSAVASKHRKPCLLDPERRPALGSAILLPPKKCSRSLSRKINDHWSPARATGAADYCFPPFPHEQ